MLGGGQEFCFWSSFWGKPGGIGSAGELGLLWRGWEKWVITWTRPWEALRQAGGAADTGDAVGGEEKAMSSLH